MRRIFGIGETVFDIIFRHDQPQHAVAGGSTFNSLISLGRCGHRPTMITETGDDHVGQLIINFMEENGVETDFVTVNLGTKTHVSLAFLDENNDAKYQFYKDHSSACIDFRFPEFQKGDIVLFGSYFAVNPIIRDYTRKFLRQAYEAGCLLYYDVNFRAAHIDDIPNIIGNIYENMQLATIVRGSTEDFQCLFNSDDPVTVYNNNISQFCKNFICTSGERGITTFFASKDEVPESDRVVIKKYEVSPIDTVSTIGAGDNFNAGFISALAHYDAEDKTFSCLNDGAFIDLLIASGISFSSHVCHSIENYIGKDFAKSVVMKRLYEKKLFLFDLDGVIIDTESQYQTFWHSIGKEFLPHIENFATRIKGSTLVAIHENYFAHDDKIREEVDKRLIDYEDNMNYSLFEGAIDFVRNIRAKGIPCAIVTSSNHKKMESLAQQLPTFTDSFDKVFTAEDAGRGKPFPDCYINAARYFGVAPNDCVVFEDSINGLKAAKASGAFVVGLSTTHSASLVAEYAHVTIREISDLVEKTFR